MLRNYAQEKIIKKYIKKNTSNKKSINISDI